MKRHKVILEHTTQRTGWFGELVKLTLLLNDGELNKLKECMIGHTGTIALYWFTHSNYCTRHHRYLIWNTFEEGEINITIKN